MPNLFAYIVLYSWPLVAWLFFRNLPAARAMLWTFILGYLFMPPAAAAFDLPVLPEISKIEMASISTLAMVIMYHGTSALRLPKNWFMLAVLGLYIFGPVATYLTNGEPLYTRGFVRPGHTISEIPAIIIERAFDLLPFLLAFSLLSRKENIRELLMVLTAVASIHSLLVLFEIRFSPQLNQWVYGFFQHSWIQMVRGDGFRPIVFLYHALWVGFFLMLTMASAISLWRHWGKDGDVSMQTSLHETYWFIAPRKPAYIYLLYAFYAFFVLILSKSLGPIMFGLAALVILLVVPTRMILWIAAAVATGVIGYPLIKFFGILPEEQIIAAFNQLSPDRAFSLAYRINNENILFERAQEKLLFGWGTYARSLFVSSTGGILTIPDGGWIVSFGAYGLAGWFSQMALMIGPVFYALRLRKADKLESYSPHISTLALLLAFNAMDMIPNDTMTLLTLILGGALWGHLESVAEEFRTQKRRSTRQSKPILPYSNTDAEQPVLGGRF